MSIPRLSVTKPVLITMLVFSFVVLGIYSYLGLAVDLFPEIDIPYVTVRTVYPGAGPVEIENLVSRPIEEEVGAINGVKNINSNSFEGVSIILVEFQLETDIDVAAMDVKDKVSAIREKLPKDIFEPVTLKLEIGAMPVLNLAISSPRPLHEVYELADDVIKPELSKISGLASIDIIGGKEREILIGVQRERLQAYNLSIMDVVGSLIGENIELPSGHITESNREYPIRVSGEFATVEEIPEIQLFMQGEGRSPVRIKDIANVVDTFEEQREKVRLNHSNAVGMSLVKRPDANVVEVVEGIYRELEKIREIIPEDLEISVVQDRSGYIKSSISEVLTNMGIGILLTALVLFFFLHNWQATLIAALAMPSSIIATFLLIRFAGFTLNMMSLTGLAISVGILVTNSIVVIENIFRRKEAGEEASEAAEKGASEIAVAVAASTLTNIVVFTPIAFMSGIVGRFFLQFGLTVTFATIFSLFVSFTMVPMLASVLLKERAKNPNRLRLFVLVALGILLSIVIIASVQMAGWYLISVNALAKIFILTILSIGIILFLLKKLFKPPLEEMAQFWWFRGFTFIFLTIVILLCGFLAYQLLTYLFGMYAGSLITALVVLLLLLNRKYPVFQGFANYWEAMYKNVQAGYRNSLTAALDHKAILLFVVALVFFGSMYCFQYVGSEFFTDADQGFLQVTMEMPAGSSISQTDKAFMMAEDIIMKEPNVKFVYTEVGRQGGSFFRGSGEGVQLGQMTVEMVDKQMRDISVEDFIKELRPKLSGIPAAIVHLMAISPGGGGNDADLMVEITGKELDELNRIADEIKVLASNTNGTTDIESSYRSGVPEIEIIPKRKKFADHGISAAQLATTLRTCIEGNTDSKFRVGNKEYNIRIRFDDPYRNFAEQVQEIKFKSGNHYIPITELTEINRREGPIQIARKNKKRLVTVSANVVNRSAGEVVAEMRQKVSGISLDSGYEIYFGGQTEDMEESFAQLYQALLLAIVLTFMVLAAILGSFLHPITIMTTLPLAMIGVVMGLIISGKTLNIMSMMAIVMLVGIVVNNAILQIDYIQLLRKRGKSLKEAVIEGCTTRLRPIVMTNLATIFGMLPLALALGEGSEMRAPIAIVSIGGLITSTIFTLFVIPVLFSALESLKAKAMN